FDISPVVRAGHIAVVADHNRNLRMRISDQITPACLEGATQRWFENSRTLIDRRDQDENRLLRWVLGGLDLRLCSRPDCVLKAQRVQDAERLSHKKRQG